MAIKNMLISTTLNKDNSAAVTCVAKLGAFEFRQVFAKTIPAERIQTYFEIQAELMYEKYLEESNGAVI
jgi:tRNA(Ile2) C34 agmatinyltransferase TiaS